MNTVNSETFCDELADFLDDKQGAVGDDVLERIIQNGVINVGVSEVELRQKFVDLYACTIEVYRQNARDDAEWHQAG